MTTVAIRPKFSDLFTRFEVLFWSLFLGIPTALGIGAHLTPQDPPVQLVGWIILWAAIGGMWLIAMLFYLRRWKLLHYYRFRVDPVGLIVGWKEDKYCVSGEMVERELNEVLTRMKNAYPNAADALRGCVVLMVEPKFTYWPGPGFLARKVAGVQDGQLLYVGWHADLKTSALQHELAHRVLQMYAGDPPEKVAHDIFEKLGIA